VPFRNNIIFAGENAISGSRFGRHHTRMRRPPPAQDRGRQRGIPVRKNAAHSSGQARAAFLQEALAPVLQEASYVRDGFGAALDELIRLAEIPTLQ